MYLRIALVFIKIALRSSQHSYSHSSQTEHPFNTMIYDPTIPVGSVPLKVTLSSHLREFSFTTVTTGLFFRDINTHLDS